MYSRHSGNADVFSHSKLWAFSKSRRVFSMNFLDCELDCRKCRKYSSILGNLAPQGRLFEKDCAMTQTASSAETSEII